MANKNIKITKIDGIEYVNKYHYDKLLKKKVPKIEKLKELGYINNKDYFVQDPANVCAILPIKEFNEDKNTLETYFGLYEEIENPEITYYHNEQWNIDCFKINGSKFSKEYLERMQSMAKVWFDKKPRVFLRKDKPKENPGIFVFGNKLAFVLAPRIEDDE